MWPAIQGCSSTCFRGRRCRGSRTSSCKENILPPSARFVAFVIQASHKLCYPILAMHATFAQHLLYSAPQAWHGAVLRNACLDSKKLAAAAIAAGALMPRRHLLHQRSDKTNEQGTLVMKSLAPALICGCWGLLGCACGRKQSLQVTLGTSFQRRGFDCMKWRLGAHLCDEILGASADLSLVRPLQVDLQDALVGLAVALRLKGRVAKQKLVAQHPQAPHVHLCVMVPALNHLWGQIVQRSTQRLPVSIHSALMTLAHTT